MKSSIMTIAMLKEGRVEASDAVRFFYGTFIDRWIFRRRTIAPQPLA